MNDYEFNPGILIGGAAAVLSVFAALAALYLWAVNRAKQQFNNTTDLSARGVVPWLSPLLLPTLAILGLGLVAHLWHAYEKKSWPEASNMIITAWAAFMILMFWLKLRRQPK
jgi:hypothetical protein